MKLKAGKLLIYFAVAFVLVTIISVLLGNESDLTTLLSEAYQVYAISLTVTILCDSTVKF